MFRYFHFFSFNDKWAKFKSEAFFFFKFFINTKLNTRKYFKMAIFRNFFKCSNLKNFQSEI